LQSISTASPIYWLETIVDTERFKGLPYCDLRQGACYQAANWIALGKTTGRGLKATTNGVKRTIKTVYGYPLVRDFREKFGVSGESKQSIK
jgi:hypothetical protein